MAQPSPRRPKDLRLERDQSLLGALLETFVLQELRRQSSARPDPPGFHHFRDRDDFEVDIVLEQGHSVAGVVPYDGTATVNFGEGLYAVPIRALWELN